MAVLLGRGLRREECAAIQMEHIQQREGRWVIIELVGKRSKTRSVPMPAWAKAAIDAYLSAGVITSGPLFRPMRRGDNLLAGPMTSQAVFDVVRSYVGAIGIEVRPHDLRRTFAKLAHKGNSPIEQIQLSLGHSSVQTWWVPNRAALQFLSYPSSVADAVLKFLVICFYSILQKLIVEE